VRNIGVPIVAMTAHALKGDRERCTNAGMNDYIAKPVDPAELESVLDRWLEAAGVGRGKEGKEALMSTDAGGRARVDLPVFDREDFIERIGGDEEAMRDILAIFLEDVEQQLAVLAGAAARGSFEELRTGAHTLKGSSASAGAKALSAVALTLEDHAKAGRIDEAKVALAQAGRCFEELKAAVAGIVAARAT
jgi:HPt (histidine-containing phosphotransfer) domain-containing protein